MQPREPLLTSPSPTDNWAESSYSLLQDLNDAAVFYTGKQYGKHLDLLLHLSRYSNLLLTVTGAEGSGKTHIKQRLLQQVDSGVVLAQVDAHKIASAGQLVPDLTAKFNLEIPPKADTALCLDEIRSFSQQLNSEGGSCLIVIDNAENLQADALEVVLDLATSSPDALRPHLVLFGRPQLFDQLNTPENQARFEAVGHHLPLQPLEDQEARAYLEHRCASVGLDAIPLDAAQIAKVLQQGQGLPGLLNVALLNLTRQAEAAPVPTLVAAEQAVLATPKKTKPQKKALAKQDSKKVTAAKKTVAAKKPSASRGSSLVPLVLAVVVLTVLGVGFLYKDSLISYLAATDSSQEEQTWLPPHLDAGATSALDEVLSRLEAENDLDLDLDEEIVDTEQKTLSTEAVQAPALDSPDDTPASAAAASKSTGSKSTTSTVTKAEPVKTAPTPTAAKSEPPKAAPTAGWQDKGSRREASLMQKQAGRYTLQMMGSRDESSVLKFIQEQGAEAAKFSYFEGRYQGEPWYVVVYGDFANRDAALEGIKNLPSRLAQQQPWAKSFASVQQDIQSRN